MINRYSIKDNEFPLIKEAIEVKDIKVDEGSFLVFIVKDKLSTDELQDLREELEQQIFVPFVISTDEVSIHEIVDKLHQEESSE